MDWLERVDSVIRIEKVAKIEAAERQFRTAVHLFFEDRDSVSIHTLGWAAHEIFDRSAGSGGSLLQDIAKDAKDKKTRKQLEEAMRFFKHHQGAQFKEIKFITNLNEWLLFDCAMMHRDVTQQLIPESKAISTWMSVRFPGIVPLKSPFPGALDALRSAWGLQKTLLSGLHQEALGVILRPVLSACNPSLPLVP